MKNICDMYYMLKRMYVYKRSNVRVQFDHPNMYKAHGRLQYKIKLFGLIPKWVNVYECPYSHWDRPTAIEEPMQYADMIIRENRKQRYSRGQKRKVRQMMIKLKTQNKC